MLLGLENGLVDNVIAQQSWRPVLTPRTHLKDQSCKVLAVVGKQKQENFWSSLAISLAQLEKPRFQLETVSQKLKWMVSKEPLVAYIQAHENQFKHPFPTHTHTYTIHIHVHGILQINLNQHASKYLETEQQCCVYNEILGDLRLFRMID